MACQYAHLDQELNVEPALLTVWIDIPKLPKAHRPKAMAEDKRNE
jgi:hypothetical protein